MEHEDFRREKNFQIVMSIARKMVRENLITTAEYKKVENEMEKKHRPVFGTIFSDISLTNGQG